MELSKPNREGFNEGHLQYLDLAADLGVYEALNEQGEALVDFMSSIPSEMHDYRYEDGKWSVKEVFSHLIAAEYYFSDLAKRLTIDQNSKPIDYQLQKYAMRENAKKPMNELIEDFVHYRRGTVELLQQFDAEHIGKVQFINESRYSPLGIGFIIAGHGIHHASVIKEKYLTKV